MSRRSPSVAPVAWRDGIHLTGTPLWCDARRRRDVCFASSEDRVARGHGQLIGTPETLAMLGVPGDAGHLAVPTRKRFTLGTLRLELIPSGRGVGAAALHVDVSGRTVLAAGVVRTSGGVSGEPSEVRTADALVVAAPFGDPRFVFPPIAQAVDTLVAWVKPRERPTLVVDSVSDAVELTTALAGHAVVTSPISSLRRAAAAVNVTIGPPRREPAVVLMLTTGRTRGILTGDSAFVSPRAIDGAHGCDAAIVWPSADGRADLLAWIDRVGARQIYVTGAGAESITQAIGPRARTLGPPRQMVLFP